MGERGDDGSFVRYGIDDRPPLRESLLLGAQHYLTMVGANIAVPLVLAGAMGMPESVVPRFVGTFFVVSGVATLAQTTFGNRYPIVQGAPFSMLAPALAIVGVVTATAPDGIEAWRAALLQLQGAIVVAAGLSVGGVFGPEAPGYVDLASVAAAEPAYPIYPLQWGVPGVTPAFVVGMLAGVAASVVESIGDYHAVARLSGTGAPSGRRTNHGIGMEGLMNVFSGLMGTGGSTSYSENIGAIGLTGVASRYVVQVGAALMLVVGFVGYFGQLVATIPGPIVGGLYIAMFGQIVAVGLSNLKYVDLDSSRNVFIVGIAIFTGMAVPAYMRSVGGVDALQEGLAGTAVFGPALGTDVVATTVYVIGTTGMAVGGIVALVLDNTVSGTDAERGLTAWEAAAESDAEFASAYDRFVADDD